jgi:hypothetical protein
VSSRSDSLILPILLSLATAGAGLPAPVCGQGRADFSTAQAQTISRSEQPSTSPIAPAEIAEPSNGRQADVQPAGGGILKGRVTVDQSQSPFLSGTVETLTKGTKVDLALMCNLNSEISQKGDEIFARVSVDLKNGQKVLLPNGWYLHGIVSDMKAQRRLGRDGYIQVDFDKLVSPDGQHDVPFNARFSSQDNQLKAIAKVVAVDAGYMTKGAVLGSVASVQMTGVPLAVATHGYSVAIGATVGAGIGLIGALKRKGKIASLFPSDEIRLNISEPITLPGINPKFLETIKPPEKLKNLELAVVEKHFDKDPLGDKQSRVLTLDVKVDNRTAKEYSFFDLAVISDHNQRYYPSMLGKRHEWTKKVPPNTAKEGTLTFSVDSPKHRYWLVLLDKTNRQELSRVPIN